MSAPRLAALLLLLVALALCCVGCAAEPPLESAAVDDVAPAADVEPAADSAPAPAPVEEDEPQPDAAAPAAQPQPDKPSQPEPQAQPQAEPAKLTCSLSIRCDTVLDKLDKLAAGKQDIIPADGLILSVAAAQFTEGESAFDVLQRETRAAGVHLEFVTTPAFNTAYIEGIGNLYEYDCGELSGWLFKVNNVFPGYGCSQYLLEDGATVEFVYSCDLGQDVGSTVGSQQ